MITYFLLPKKPKSNKKYSIIYGRAHLSNIYLNTKDEQETGKYYDPHPSDLSYIRSWLIDHSLLRLRVVINTSLPPPQAGATSYQEILLLIADICLQMCQGAGSEIKLNSRKKLFVRKVIDWFILKETPSEVQLDISFRTALKSIIFDVLIKMQLN